MLDAKVNTAAPLISKSTEKIAMIAPAVAQ
jgi:hypothetical protein